MKYKLKKIFILIVAAGLVLLAYSVYAIYRIWGMKLLYIGTTEGAILANTWRYTLLIACILLAIGIFYLRRIGKNQVK